MRIMFSKKEASPSRFQHDRIVYSVLRRVPGVMLQQCSLFFFFLHFASRAPSSRPGISCNKQPAGVLELAERERRGRPPRSEQGRTGFPLLFAHSHSGSQIGFIWTAACAAVSCKRSPPKPKPKPKPKPRPGGMVLAGKWTACALELVASSW
jgi:hypothetical protein